MSTQLFDSIFDAATRIAVANLVERQGRENVNIDVLSFAGKQVLNGSIDRLLGEWEMLLESVAPDVTIRAFLNAQAAELGAKIVSAYFDELAWHC